MNQATLPSTNRNRHRRIIRPPVKRKSRAMLWLAIGMSTVVAVLIVGLLVWSQGGSLPAVGTDPRTITLPPELEKQQPHESPADAERRRLLMRETLAKPPRAGETVEQARERRIAALREIQAKQNREIQKARDFLDGYAPGDSMTIEERVRRLEKQRADEDFMRRLNRQNEQLRAQQSKPDPAN